MGCASSKQAPAYPQPMRQAHGQKRRKRHDAYVGSHSPYAAGGYMPHGGGAQGAFYSGGDGGAQGFGGGV
ncbi:uncharacterized protein EKO05_0002933 [Ascochyta rabiei]|uniref:uncharacterized protein n=1 Tax=Didymella rabiei TaxID=5454 RepID=UPI0021FF489F|nr:uncharacterized protein EKO05_0002933 [Ascochyta rabiei]UPX12383.1 hypothetical protein EKO05_0002933 [Ascochyta rabiei]